MSKYKNTKQVDPPLKDYDHLVKILLVGDSGCGKTSLLLRFSQDIFSDSFISTIGVDFQIKSVECKGKRLKLQLWDTAGQERFRSLTSAYYRGAHGIVVVYDSTVRQSFENVQNWIQQIRNHAKDNVQMILVATKSDLVEKRQVEPEEAAKIAQENGFMFQQTCSKTGENVADAFMRLAGSIYDNLLLPKEQEEASNEVGPTKDTYSLMRPALSVTEKASLVFGLFMYYYGIGAHVGVLQQYWVNSDWFFFAFMLGVLFLSTLTTSFFMGKVGGKERKGGILNFALEIFRMGNILEVFDSIRAGHKTLSLVWCGFLQGVWEGIPASVLQLYVALSMGKGNDALFIVSITGSMFSLAKGLVAFETYKVEEYRRLEIPMKSKYFISLILFRMTEIFSRVLFLSLFAIIFGPWIALVIGVDFLLVVFARFLTTRNPTIKNKFMPSDLVYYCPIWMFVFWVQPNTGLSIGGYQVQIFSETACFKSGMIVKFGETQVPSVFRSPNLLVCIAPAHEPGAVSVNVLDSTGRSDSSVLFTYISSEPFESELFVRTDAECHFSKISSPVSSQEVSTTF